MKWWLWNEINKKERYIYISIRKEKVGYRLIRIWKIIVIFKIDGIGIIEKDERSKCYLKEG